MQEVVSSNLTSPTISDPESTRGVGFFSGGGRGLAFRTGSGFLAAVTSHSSKDPLHGVTLERLLTELVAAWGWEELARKVDVRCFRFDPSIKSSLVFLRRTPWARAKVEELYVRWRRQQGGTG